MVDETQMRAFLAQAGRGDKGAMKAIYEAFADPIARFARSRGADPVEAADVAHETLLEAWRVAARFEGRSSVKSWMFGIARNKTVDRLRKAARERVAEPDENAPDDAPDAEQVMAALQEGARLRRCIADLSPPHRTAIQLAFYEELSYAEIAEIEDCPVGTVKTRIHHAKKLLMRCLTAKPVARAVAS
ncbi:MAG: RNA polymerase sigma factor [Parvularculaceae bacterium]